MPASTEPGSSPLTLELRDIAKSFGAVAALRSGTLEVRPGSIHALVGENGAGKSTLVKIVAGVHRRDAGTFRLLGVRRRLRIDRRVEGRRRRRHLPGADALPRPLGRREHLHGSPPAPRRPPDRPAADVRRVDGPLRAARRAHRPAAPGARPVDRRPADHRDRQGDLARRGAARHGRADRRAERCRGRAAVRRRPQPARRGSRSGLHLAPVRRGVRAVRHRHRDAGRGVRRDRRRSPRPRSTRSSAGWSAARWPSCSPRPRPRSARSSSRSTACRASVCSTTSPSPCGRARSSRWPDSSARAGARSPARSSASTGTTPARSGSAASPCAPTIRGRRSGPGWPSCRRTGASRAWSPRARWPATSPA